MKKLLLTFISAFTLFTISSAQLQEGKKNIEKLCGCFEVVFKYAETFSPDEEYEYRNREVTNGGLELVLPIEMSDKRIVLQHLLVVSDRVIVKHWREDWTWENSETWEYKGDLEWTRKKLPADQVKGKWTQTVWEVSDAPRYQGFSNWVQTDGKTFWQNTTDAPLPRREYKKRSDYNILKRTNRIYVDSSGWLHEQDNQKILATGEGRKLIAEEKGINTYKRVDDSKCKAGLEYWEKYKVYWENVRKVWEEQLAVQQTIRLHRELEGKALHDHLYALGKDFVDGKVKKETLSNEIHAYLSKYMRNSAIAGQ